MTNIAILDLGFSNIASIGNAFYSQGWDYKIISQPDQFIDFSHLVIPGVGNYKSAVEKIESNSLRSVILDFAKEGKPILGICLGMQLLSSVGEEGGLSKGLGLLDGSVTLLDSFKGYPLPHVGWNEVDFVACHPVFDGIKSKRDFYFVHSYRFSATNYVNVLGVTKYFLDFTSVIGSKNIVGVQFHPEKSQKNGLRILDNFANWNGEC